MSNNCPSGFLKNFGICRLKTTPPDEIRIRHPTGVSRPASPPLKIERNYFRNTSGWRRWNTISQEYKCPVYVQTPNGPKVAYYQRKWMRSYTKCDNNGQCQKGPDMNPQCS